MNIAISDKHIKGNQKIRRMERKGGRRKPTGPYSNQSQEQVLQHAIDAVKKGTARFISNDGRDFTIEVDSIHGAHPPRQFNIHSGGGSANTRYIHQIYGESSGFDTPDDAEYSDSEDEVETTPMPIADVEPPKLVSEFTTVTPQSDHKPKRAEEE